jgi:hypothetical protein
VQPEVLAVAQGRQPAEEREEVERGGQLGQEQVDRRDAAGGFQVVELAQMNREVDRRAEGREGRRDQRQVCGEPVGEAGAQNAAEQDEGEEKEREESELGSDRQPSPPKAATKPSSSEYASG